MTDRSDTVKMCGREQGNEKRTKLAYTVKSACSDTERTSVIISLQPNIATSKP